MRHIMIVAVVATLGLFIPTHHAVADDAETARIKTIITDILTRKDLDKLLATVDKDALFYGWNDPSATNIRSLLQQRDKNRALGKGSYEEVVYYTITYRDDLGIAVYTTKFTEGNNSHYRANTITLRKKAGAWKIVGWHCSMIPSSSTTPRLEFY